MQVTYTYNNSLQRNDASLMKYGFIQQADPPRLCGVDLPGGQLGEVYEGLQWEPVPYSALASREEMARLSDILTAFPTTAEEDAALLAGMALFFRQWLWTRSAMDVHTGLIDGKWSRSVLR